MLSKRDYISYFNNIRETEILMLTRAKELGKYFTDDESVRLIEEWHHDEEHHKNIVEEIIGRIK